MQQTHKVWRFLYHTAVGFGGLALIVYYFIHIVTLSELGPVSYLPILPLYLGIIWLSIFVHEIGHVVAALVVGFRIEAIVCGPIKLEDIHKKWRWGINWRSDVPGYVLATPQSISGFQWKYCLFALAGPFFTLLLLLVSLLLFLSYLDVIDVANINTGFRHLHGGSVLPFYLAGFCSLYNLVCLLLCLIPMVLPTGQLNDAGTVCWVLKFGRRDFQLTELTDSMQKGVRPRDIDHVKLLDCLGSPRTGTVYDCFTFLVGYYHYLDARDLSVAELLLAKAVQCYGDNPDLATPSVLLEHIYFHAMFRQPVDHAASAFELCEGHASVQKPTLLRAKAATHFATGEYSHAITVAEESLMLLADPEDKGGSIAEREWVEEIITRSKTAMQNPASISC
ncbi:MAG: hypothetical protein U0796_03620 [Gemmatales bacterium]